MKKSIQVSLVVTLAIATSVLMSACVASSSSKASSMESSSTAISSSVSSDTAVSSEAAVSSETASSNAESKALNQKLPTLEEYVKSPEIQNSLKPIIDSLASQGIKLDVSADGNKLIYTCSYLSNVKQDAKKLNSALEQQTSTYQNSAAVVQKCVSTDNLVMVVRYLDSNKKVVVSKEFPAK